MKNLFLTLILLFLTFPCFSQVKDTIYYDKTWEETSKENHSFYRPLPLKETGELVFIQDYHKNGNLQMQGYAYKKNIDQFVGNVYWYDENGDYESYRLYNNPTDLSFKYYYPDGKLWQIVYNKKTTIYDKLGNIFVSEDAFKFSDENKRVINVNNVDYISYNYLYKKNKNKYREIEYELKTFNNDEEYQNPIFGINYKKLISYKDIEEPFDVEKITKQTSNELLKKLRNKSLQIKTEDEKLTFQLSTNKLFFKVTEWEKEERKIINSYSYPDSENYDYFIMNINNSRPIIVLNSSYTEYYIIPTSKEYFIYSENYEPTSKKAKWKIKKFDYGKYYAYKYIHIHKNKNNKSQLRDNFGKVLIKEEFDSLKFNETFIIGKNKKDEEIYSTKNLEKIPLKNIKKAYSLKDDYIQILHKNKIKIINDKGKKAKYKPKIYPICGAWSTEYEYSINREKSSENYHIKYCITNGDITNLRVLELNNTSKYDSLVFLNNKKEFHNTDGMGSFNMEYNIIKAYKNGKVGLHTIDYKKFNYKLDMENGFQILDFDEYPNSLFSNLDLGDIVVKHNGKYHILDDFYLLSKIDLLKQFENFISSIDTINSQIVLSPIYDTIEEIDNLLVFKNIQGVGIYPFHDKVRYKWLGKRNKNFIRFKLPNNKEGWLDINTGVEYLDE